jgi:hypothetical protein
MKFVFISNEQPLYLRPSYAILFTLDISKSNFEQACFQGPGFRDNSDLKSGVP